MEESEKQSRKRYVFGYSQLRPRAHSLYRGRRPAGIRGYFRYQRHYTPCNIQGKGIRSHLSMYLSDNRRPGRRQKKRQERELRTISTYSPRSMLIMLRIESRNSKRHTSRNITLGNTLALVVAFDVLRTSRITGFVVSRTIWNNLMV